jgi:hypothetical protein
MSKRRSTDDSETMIESVPEGPRGEKFVRRPAVLSEMINGAPVQDTTKEFVIQKKHDARNQ